MQEKWRSIPGIRSRYAVSTDGRVKNTETGRIMGVTIVRGYARVSIRTEDGKCLCPSVARLVLRAFRPIPFMDRYKVKYKDGEHLNVCLDNLDWEDRFGSNHGRAKLTEAQVKEIRTMHDTTPLTYQAIADLYRVSYSTVYEISTGGSWAHVL